MKRDLPVLYRSVLECQSDGVIAVNFDGRVILLNRAAAEILSLDRDGVVGQLFVEAFLAVEGLDELSQAILDAVSERSIGERRIVAVRSGEGARSLAVTTSYLRESGDDRTERLGVVAVFSDITELEELRKAEAGMAEALRGRHAELQQAYRRIEENNAALAATAKKIQAARIAATGLVIALFVGAGAYSWIVDPADDGSASDRGRKGASLQAEARASEGPRTIVVRPRPVSSSISLTGRLAPWREAKVVSPIAGKVLAVHFLYGEAVRQGERLVEIDTAEIERSYRDARRDYIGALKEFRQLRDWENSPEVSQAKRSLARAELVLKNQKNRLATTAMLLEQGIVPANEHEAARQQYFNQQLDFEAARQNLHTLLARNNEDSRQMAQLALDNARERMQELERGLESGEVRAPISGIVLDTRRTGGNSRSESVQGLTQGRSVQEGELLLTIADLRRMSVVSSVDEVFIPDIRTGQRLRATGDGFSGLTLEGAIIHVSSEAGSQRGSPLPAFEIIGLLDELGPAQHGRLRLGMSVDMEVVTYSNPAALMVPFAAVAMRQNKRWLKVRDRDPVQLRDVQVKTGVTTVDSVEILEGISANDEIVVADK